MGEHSTLSPSAAHRWMRCPASVAICQKYPKTTSAYAEEGTLAHAIAADLLNGKITEVKEDFAPVLVYTESVEAMTQDAVITWVEEKLDLSDVLGVSDQKGTGDFIALMPDGELQVHDLKYGKGVPVSAEGNEQLIIYGLGAMELAQLVDDVTHVRLVIHMPRLGFVSEVVYTVEEMDEYKEAIQRCAEDVAALLSRRPDETIDLCNFVPGEKQCRWCDAKGECAALKSHCLDTVLGSFEDVTEAVEAVPVDDETGIADVYGQLDLISQWVSAVKARAMTLMMEGNTLPGYKLVEGKPGNRAWADMAEAEETMKSMRLKRDEMYDFKIISPTTAEKLLKKSNPKKWNRLQPTITRKPPAPTIVPVSDKRPELVLSSTAEEFEDVTAEDLV